jgi:hypothetical protein
MAAECSAKATTFSIESQGENTTTRIDVVVRTAEPSCLLATSATVTIERDGARAGIAGNPRHDAIRRTIRSGPTTIVRLDWTNWCQARVKFRLNVAVGGRQVSAPVDHVPLCLQPGVMSRLVTVV